MIKHKENNKFTQKGKKYKRHQGYPKNKTKWSVNLYVQRKHSAYIHKERKYQKRNNPKTKIIHGKTKREKKGNTINIIKGNKNKNEKKKRNTSENQQRRENQ